MAKRRLWCRGFSESAFRKTTFALLFLLTTATMQAQTFTVLHSFGAAGDGFNPEWAGVSFDNHGNLYGTTIAGGTASCDLTFGCGTVYQMTPNSDGTWTETVIHNFGLNDVSSPLMGVAFDRAGNLYTTGEANGHTYTYGGVVELSPNANGTWNEQVLYDFNNTDGADPAGIAVDRHNNVFCSVTNGWSYDAGLIFGLASITPIRRYPLTIYPFRGGTDGAGPYGTPIFDASNNLYGTTAGGGAYGAGTAFKLTHNGFNLFWTKSTLYSFRGGSDGTDPVLGLAFDAHGNLYGTTYQGGALNFGTVYELSPNPDGTWTENVIYPFQGGIDGQWPSGSVVVDSAGNIYGTTSAGGSGTNPYGTVFRLTPSVNGQWTKTILHNFSGPDGAYPDAGLTMDSAGNVYGTTNEGGAYQFQNGGVVFEITP